MSRGGRMAMSEGKNVTLNITTKRSDEVINLITDAVCYAENGEIRFEYNESLAAKEDTRTVMTISPESVMINRVNNAGESTVMLFEERKTYKGAYCTEFGTFDMSIFTTRMRTNIFEDRVSASFCYDLRFAGRGMGRFNIDVSANI